VRGGVHASQRNLLDLQSDDVASASKIGGLAAVVPARLDASIDDEARRTGRIGIQHQNAVAHATRGHCGEPSELAAAEDSDGCAGKNGWDGSDR
jgi:hypothetical protein